MNKDKSIPNREVWDKVSEAYPIEIQEDEEKYADEIYNLMLQEGIYPPAKILELGSGSGHLSACLAKKGYRVSLLDFSTGALEKSKKTFEKYNLQAEFLKGDLFDLGNVSKEYDFVWNSGVMEHFDDENLVKIFSQISSVMKDKFMFLVPNSDSVAYLLMRYNLEGRGKWEYGQEYLRRNYLEMAERAGLKGAVRGYAASSISIWHFESTFLNDENKEIYASLVNDKIMPSNESYLIAYVVQKSDMSSPGISGQDQSDMQIEPEDFFVKSAENYRLKKDKEYFMSETKRLQKVNELQEEQIYSIDNVLKKTKLELENAKTDLQLQRNEWVRKQEEWGSRTKEWETQREEWESRIKEWETQKEEWGSRTKEWETQREEWESRIKEWEAQKVNLTEENNALKKQLSHVCGEILPQISSSTLGIYRILDAKWFRRVIAVHAIVGALAEEKLLSKIKIIAKLMLRLVGVKYDFLIDDYRMNLKIAQHLRNIDNIVEISKINVSALTDEIKDKKIIVENVEKREKECIYAEEPLVSVLLPVYNHADFIIDAIKGVQYQTYSNWELIILNDGSTDGLLEKIKDYDSDPRIKIYTQDNQRLPNGLSNLHNLANGQFITWTSADNIMKQTMLESLVSKLMESPDAVMVYADVAIIDDKGDFKTTGYREMNRDSEKQYIMRLPHCTDALDAEADNFINACFMYRAEPVKALKGLYSADLEGLEDYDFWLRLRTFGKIKHLNNKEPLYYYRVHENTMSEDLLKNKLDEHVKRTQKMIEYSQRKDKFAEESWNIEIEKNVFGAELFEKSLKKLNYAYKNVGTKRGAFCDIKDINAINEKQLLIALEGDFYQIYCKENGRVEKRAQIYKGFDVNPLAKKVRQTYIPGLFWEYPAEFVGMKVLGCHLDIRNIDVEKTIEFINSNKQILFSFSSLPETNVKEIEMAIRAKCQNVVFMGEREYGSQMYLYTSWDAMFIPPLKENVDIMPAILLGWSIGRWVLVEKGNFSNSLPLVATYYYGEKLLGIKKIRDIGAIEDVLDSYLMRYTTAGAAKQVLDFMNGIGQDVLVERPDFKLIHKERKFPPTLIKKEINVPEVLKEGYIGLMVDSLDKGGLEQVVALLAREFRKNGLNIRVLCTCKGGEVARELQEDGIEVVVFSDDSKAFERYLKDNRPFLINSHYAKKMLHIVKSLDIPIIEVIHNMYVFQNETSLKNEYELSKVFTKMIAVSSIVKQVYEKKVNKNISDKIEVVGNAASTSKIFGLNREYIRALLNIPKDGLVFINVSSIDSRKNQIGLIKAFEIFNQTANENSYLIIVGNVLSEFYDKAVMDYIDTITCRDKIIKLAYHKDIGDLYNASDVFVMPSYYEGWSIAATEALYCGLPIIHAFCGSAKELINNGKNGIMIANPAGDITKYKSDELMHVMNGVNSDNVNELVSAMQQIDDDREKWKEQRGAIAAESIMNYSQQGMIEGYLEVFANTVKNI